MKYLFLFLLLLSNSVFATPTIEEILNSSYTQEEVKNYFGQHYNILDTRGIIPPNNIIKLDVGEFYVNSIIAKSTDSTVYELVNISSPNISSPTEHIAFKFPEVGNGIKEQKVLRILDHPNIIKLVYPDSKFTLMELANGTLQNIIEHDVNFKSDLMLRAVSRDYLKAVSYLEDQNIFYPDDTYSNIVYFIQSDNSISFKLTDMDVELILPHSTDQSAILNNSKAFIKRITRSFQVKHTANLITLIDDAQSLADLERLFPLLDDMNMRTLVSQVEISNKVKEEQTLNSLWVDMREECP